MWQNKKLLGHIELVLADNGVAMFLRHLGEMNEKNRMALLQFSEKEQLFSICNDGRESARALVWRVSLLSNQRFNVPFWDS